MCVFLERAKKMLILLEIRKKILDILNLLSYFGINEMKIGEHRVIADIFRARKVTSRPPS